MPKIIRINSIIRKSTSTGRIMLGIRLSECSVRYNRKEKNDLLFVSGDNEAFADALFRLMGSRKEREIMGKNAPKVKTAYSESSILDKWTVLFNELNELS